ncbi:hypothetical protein, partial [Ruminococcus sp.]|uniref:MuF-C-terminal domain-containing protein n=1 Tax=Ruminococcus sp. TaxID=41978 RepID=UPI003AB5E43D
MDKSHYNSEMQQISDENAKLGVQTEFIIGGAAIPFTSGKRARGVFDRSTNTAIIQYDHARFSPEQINRHELVHKDYQSNRVHKVKNIILNSLSVSKRNSIKQKLMRDYNGMVENNEDAVFEEFICNVLAGMNEYSVEFAYLADAYWSGGELVDFYSAADYKGMKDSGGENENIIGNIGFGDEIALSTSSNGIDDIEIYDYTKPFAEQVEDWKQGKIPQNDTLLVGGTPEVLKEIGFNALPVTMNQTHVDYAYNGKNGDIKSDHVIKDLIKDLPEKLEHPLAVIASDSKPGRVVALLGLNNPNTGYKVVVPVEVDGFGTQNNISIDSNALTSVYGRKNALVQLKEAIENDSVNDCRLFYWNKNEAVSLLQAQGLQLPNHLPQDGFVHSIRENGSKVNMKFENETESQQFKRWFGDWKKNPNR